MRRPPESSLDGVLLFGVFVVPPGSLLLYLVTSTDAGLTPLRAVAWVGATLLWFVLGYLLHRGQEDGVEGLRSALAALRALFSSTPALPAGEAGRESLCQYCGTELEDLPLIVCPACETPHHRDCWDEYQGCTTYGCEGTAAVPELQESRHLRRLGWRLGFGGLVLGGILAAQLLVFPALEAYGGVRVDADAFLGLLIGFGGLAIVARSVMGAPGPRRRRSSRLLFGRSYRFVMLERLLTGKSPRGY